jgi:predicted aldo/keto reductase-like oxidoreductase
MKITDLEHVQPESLSGHRNISQSDESIPFYRKLGRTDLDVSCLGIGGGGSISSEDTLYAFEQGINYFFYSSDLHHNIYSSMSGALKKLCSRSSSQREKVVLATVTYMKGPDAGLASLMDQFTELEMDYIDVFFWGWIDQSDATYFDDSMAMSRDLRGANSVYQRMIEKMVGTTEKMKKMGIVRYVGASFHDLNYASQWLDSPLLDVVMIRNNIAHRTSQKLVLPLLNADDPSRPGVVTFKSAGMINLLSERPPGLPDGCWEPSVPDLYRYSLCQNSVDVALMGPETREHVDAAIHGMSKGKLTSAEIDYLNIYGDLHRQKLSADEIPVDKLIYSN